MDLGTHTEPKHMYLPELITSYMCTDIHLNTLSKGLRHMLASKHINTLKLLLGLIIY